MLSCVPRYLGKREVIRSVVIGLVAAVIEVGHRMFRLHVPVTAAVWVKCIGQKQGKPSKLM